MPNVLNLFLIEDPNGVFLRNPDGSTIPGSTERASLVGDCTVYANGSDGSNIVNDPAANGGLCALNAKTVRITLQYKGSSFVIPGRQPVPVICVQKSQSDKTCDNPNFLKRVSLESDKVLLVNLKNLPNNPHVLKNKFYSINFATPDGRTISLDPKIINRPHEEISLLRTALHTPTGLAFLGGVILITAVIAFAVGRLFRRAQVVRRTG